MLREGASLETALQAGMNPAATRNGPSQLQAGPAGGLWAYAFGRRKLNRGGSASRTTGPDADYENALRLGVQPLDCHHTKGGAPGQRHGHQDEPQQQCGKRVRCRSGNRPPHVPTLPKVLPTQEPRRA